MSYPNVNFKYGKKLLKMKRINCVLFIVLLSGLLWIAYINEEIVYNGFQTHPQWLNEFRNTRPIFFTISAQNQTTLSLRLACAVESASLHHPNRTILVLSLSKLEGPSIKVLRLLPNVQFHLIDVDQVLSETPLDVWHKNGSYKDSEFRVNHLSDALRLALLFKCGGIYLDVDVICLKSLEDLHNAIGLQDVFEVNGAVLIFDMLHRYIYRCMTYFASNYIKNVWAAQGPELLTSVLKEMCDVENVSTEHDRIKTCSGVDVLPTFAFYPVPYPDWERFFIPNTNIQFNESVYTIHLWNKLSKKTLILPESGTVLNSIAETHCPKIYEIFRAQQFF